MFEWTDDKPPAPKPKFPKFKACGKRVSGGWCGKKKNHWWGCKL